MLKHEKGKSKKIVVVVEHSKSKQWSERRMRKGRALNAMMKMMTFPTKRSLCFRWPSCLNMILLA
jgi:hypothetical protein